MGIVSSKLRNSAKGQLCTLRTCICNHDPETTVLAHLPSPIKGMGNKGDDWHAVFACSTCHDAMDRRSPVETNWTAVRLRALQETQRVWFEMGLMKIPVDTHREKPSSKILPRRHLASGEILP
jgi:hypothetical protein